MSQNNHIYHPPDLSGSQAAQALQALQPIGNPGQRLHFWNVNSGAYYEIREIHNKGPNHNFEDCVWSAWEAILVLYFRQYASIPNGVIWRVRREAYRGVPPFPLTHVRPDVLCVRLTQDPAYIGLHPTNMDRRDFLWVECKAATHHSAHGWKEAISGAAARLQHSHPTRKLWLIVCIGLNYLMFTWDPNHTIQHRQFIIRSENGHNIWAIDDCLKCVRPEEDDWFDRQTGEINLGMARSLDCWTMTNHQGGQILQNTKALTDLEQFLLTLQNVPLNGFNPAVWS